MKLYLLTNATVVDDPIRFVSQKSKSEIEPSSNGSRDDKQESEEPDYDEDQDQLEEEHKEESGEITTTRTNRIF
jgi:hypothetical protein